MAVERTLSIIKPDAVEKGLIGRIIDRFEGEGLKPVAMRMEWLSPREAEGFYAVHQTRPFFNDLVKFMTSGPVLLIVLEGEYVHHLRWPWSTNLAEWRQDDHERRQSADGHSSLLPAHASLSVYR